MAGVRDDELALGALARAYATHADRREGASVAELFEPDAALRIRWRSGARPPAESRGHRQIAAVIRGLDQFVSTFHVVTNQTVAITGDEADGVVDCIAHHLAVAGDQATDHVLFIRYHDRYRRSGDGWRIAERETVVEWSEERLAVA